MMAEKARILHDDEAERLLYEGDRDGIVFCKLKDYFSGLELERNPECYTFMDDSGGKYADRRYISRKYYFSGGTAEVMLLSNEHLLVVSRPPDLDLGNVTQAVPEIREHIPGEGFESKEVAQKRLEDRMSE
jgi:hypothetical protein